MWPHFRLPSKIRLFKPLSNMTPSVWGDRWSGGGGWPQRHNRHFSEANRGHFLRNTCFFWPLYQRRIHGTWSKEDHLMTRSLHVSLFLLYICFWCVPAFLTFPWIPSCLESAYSARWHVHTCAKRVILDWNASELTRQPGRIFKSIWINNLSVAHFVFLPRARAVIAHRRSAFESICVIETMTMTRCERLKSV